MARHMAEQGFDTWILEVRGSGLSKREGQFPSSQTVSKATVTDHGIDTQLAEEPEKMYDGGTKVLDESDSASNIDENVASRLSNIFFQVYEKLNKVMNDGQSRLLSTALVDRISKLLESFQLSDRYAQFRENIQQALNERQNSAIAKQIETLSSQLLKLFEDGQWAVSPQLLDLQGRIMNGRQLSELQERLVVILDDYQKLLDLLVTYDWDFDNLLEEDVPAAMEYIRSVSKPKDGNIHTIGHSMGGILLYSMISSNTIKHLPVYLVTYRLFGGKSSHHYGHYDLVCAHMAKQEVFPCIQEFLIRNDDCTKD